MNKLILSLLFLISAHCSFGSESARLERKVVKKETAFELPFAEQKSQSHRKHVKKAACCCACVCCCGTVMVTTSLVVSASMIVLMEVYKNA